MATGEAPTAIGEDQPLDESSSFGPGPGTARGPSPWQPITNPVDLKHLGKLGEEVNELGRIQNRTVIQGLHGIDPKEQVSNKVALEDEMADVLALIALNLKHFKLDEDRIMLRMENKMRYIAPWFLMP